MNEDTTLSKNKNPDSNIKKKVSLVALSQNGNTDFISSIPPSMPKGLVPLQSSRFRPLEDRVNYWVQVHGSCQNDGEAIFVLPVRLGGSPCRNGSSAMDSLFVDRRLGRRCGGKRPELPVVRIKSDLPRAFCVASMHFPCCRGGHDLAL